ncbi:DEAD/DEAH box helicase [Nocardioides sp. LHD-245]|uniref:RecQ family ATP-dependent DNA helicase n=1 Tax=Nocardioides sp. LHD-245 TaxID=3051387 RepID=UPI0027E1CE29|nr:DEAD/DEAH box helicase [Nocardioides sp. LHD-245]
MDTEAPTDAAVRDRAEQHLRALVGSPDATLYDDQWAAIAALVVDRRRALVVQRTGWGKSAVYFVATLLLREQGSGPTVIISPLLALMRNQIAAAERAGIRAVTVNSTNMEQWDEVHRSIAAGEVDVLLVSPERLNNPGFRDEVLPRLAATCGLLVVDEAHCISDWGHDFRPDYRRIRTLLRDLPAGIPVLATTATANQRVTDDVAEQLNSAERVFGDEQANKFPEVASRHAAGQLNSAERVFGDEQANKFPEVASRHAAGQLNSAERVFGDERVSGGDTLVLRGTLDRASLRLGVIRLTTAEQRLAWLADHLAEQPGSGIVYCLTVAATQEVADYLRSRGHQVAAYSGQTEQTERLALEQALIDGEVKALVATSALGMGFDAALGFVVNLGAPNSPVAYYQQVGRAGRGAIDDATVVLLPATEDRDIWAYFASLAFPREELVRETLAVLAEEGRALSTAALEPRVDLSRNRLETMLKVLDVDGAVRRVKGGWEATGEPWAYDAQRYARVAAARQAEQQAMLDYLRSDECRMRYLRRQLDDPEVLADPGWRCGRCDNCGGLGLSSEVSAAAVEEAAERIARPGVPIEPRKLWPTGLAAIGVSRSGRIKQPAAEGRAIARLTDLGHGAALRGLFAAPADAAAGGAQDGPVPDSLARAMVAMLQDWQPEVDAIVVVESERRPTLTADLAAGLSRFLRVPIVGRWAVVDPSVGPDRGATNSAQRVAAVSRRCALRLDDPDGVRDARVLLVDDRLVTGWSLTLGAEALHDAGAASVVPLVLGIAG